MARLDEFVQSHAQSSMADSQTGPMWHSLHASASGVCVVGWLPLHAPVLTHVRLGKSCCNCNAFGICFWRIYPRASTCELRSFQPTARIIEYDGWLCPPYWAVALMCLLPYRKL